MIMINTIFENIFIFSILVISAGVYELTGKLVIKLIKSIIDLLLQIKRDIEQIESIKNKIIPIRNIIVGFGVYKLYDFYCYYYSKKYYYW